MRNPVAVVAPPGRSPSILTTAGEAILNRSGRLSWAEHVVVANSTEAASGRSIAVLLGLAAGYQPRPDVPATHSPADAIRSGGQPHSKPAVPRTCVWSCPGPDSEDDGAFYVPFPRHNGAHPGRRGMARRPSGFAVKSYPGKTWH